MALSKDKINLTPVIRYKIDGGYLWHMAGVTEVWQKCYYIGNDILVVVVNQKFGENAVGFYSSLGMKGHNGIDFYAKDGACLYAPSDGIVMWVNNPNDPANYNQGYGGMIQIQSEQSGQKFMVTLGHLKETFVQKGDRVWSWQLIGLCDNTGQYTTGSHLHYGFALLDKSGNRLNTDNGYLGYVDQAPLIQEQLVATDQSEFKKLYEYAKANHIWYIGFGGGDNFEIAKKKLGIKGVTRSHYYDYLLRNKLGWE